MLGHGPASVHWAHGGEGQSGRGLAIFCISLKRKKNGSPLSKPFLGMEQILLFPVVFVFVVFIGRGDFNVSENFIHFCGHLIGIIEVEVQLGNDAYLIFDACC